MHWLEASRRMGQNYHALQKRNRELRDEIRSLHDMVNSFAKLIENLKCCGNCNRDACHYKKFYDNNHYCKDWGWDTLIQKDREVEN